jgi:hypothetical protein
MKSSMKIFFSNMHSLRKKSITLFIVLVTLTGFRSYAQGFHFGLEAGSNFFKISGRSFDGKLQPAFSAGAFAELKLLSKWGLQGELKYNETIAQTTSDFNQIYQGASFTNVYLNYVSLPVMLYYKPFPELSILLGPQYSFLASQTTGLTPDGKNSFAKSDLSVLFGGQLNLGKVKVGLRYNIGTININARDGDQWKLQGVQAYIGYRIF